MKTGERRIAMYLAGMYIGTTGVKTLIMNMDGDVV
jgi:hypothetical protein